MKEVISLLRELQKVDTAVERIQSRKTRLPGLIADLEKSFASTKQQVEDQEGQLQEATRKHREKEELLRRGQESIKKAKARQFEVKTNKEYEAVLKEIESLEVKNGQLEDEILEAMEEMDRGRVLLRDIERDLAGASRRHEEEKEQYSRELAAADEELRLAREKGAALRSRIAPEILKKYDSIRHVNHGIAVIGIWKEVCQGCRMNVPPQLYNEIQKENDIRFCPNCNRILYWDDQSGTENGTNMKSS